MRVKVLDERCQGHAMCFLACPELFALRDDDGHAQIRDDDVPAEFEDVVRKAQHSCPEEAIVIL